VSVVAVLLLVRVVVVRHRPPPMEDTRGR
jgi:hypothetical protein